MIPDNKLVGDADGGQELPKEKFEALVDKYHASWEDGSRLCITWACVLPEKERECIRCKPNFQCLCKYAINLPMLVIWRGVLTNCVFAGGHRLNGHAWFVSSQAIRQLLVMHRSFLTDSLLTTGKVDHLPRARVQVQPVPLPSQTR